MTLIKLAATLATAGLLAMSVSSSGFAGQVLMIPGMHGSGPGGHVCKNAADNHDWFCPNGWNCAIKQEACVKPKP